MKVGVKCPICLSELDLEGAAALQCGHTFHYECIQLWLQRSNTCPTCRISTRATNVIRRLYFSTEGSWSLSEIGLWLCIEQLEEHQNRLTVEKDALENELQECQYQLSREKRLEGELEECHDRLTRDKKRLEFELNAQIALFNEQKKAEQKKLDEVRNELQICLNANRELLGELAWFKMQRVEKEGVKAETVDRFQEYSEEDVEEIQRQVCSVEEISSQSEAELGDLEKSRPIEAMTNDALADSLQPSTSGQKETPIFCRQWYAVDAIEEGSSENANQLAKLGKVFEYSVFANMLSHIRTLFRARETMA